MKLDVLDAANATNPDKLFAAIGASGAHGVVVACDPFFILNRAQLVQFAASKRLPAMYFSKLFVDAGGLMSYGPDQADSFRRAATYVDKILKGANPADLPIEQPTRFDLVINMKTAKALGLTIPQRVLLRAEVID
jgi:putative ABC transport system substrate-binding protein